MKYEINTCYVFDYDGTLALNGEITKENLEMIKKIKNKVLNTSREFNEIPEGVRKMFPEILTLNGSKYFQNNNLVKKYKKFKKGQLNKIINWAKDNGYNISFNSTTNRWQNVSNPLSIKFFRKNNIQYTDQIVVPQEVYLVSISHNKKVVPPKMAIFSRLNIFQQTQRIVEISPNNKGNIKKIKKNFVSFGDGKNDEPMFKKSKKYFRVENAFLKGLIKF